MVYCKAVFMGHLPSRLKNNLDDEVMGVVSGAHEIVMQHVRRGQGWEECKEALDNLRHVVSRFRQSGWQVPWRSEGE